MSPTSYQTAPPRERMIAESSETVKFLRFRRAQGSWTPARADRRFEWLHQELYGVFSNGETALALLCTSVTPVVVWSGLSSKSSVCVCQSLRCVMGSVGISRM